jgi:hypothetical protein
MLTPLTSRNNGCTTSPALDGHIQVMAVKWTSLSELAKAEDIR